MKLVQNQQTALDQSKLLERIRGEFDACNADDSPLNRDRFLGINLPPFHKACPIEQRDETARKKVWTLFDPPDARNDKSMLQEELHPLILPDLGLADILLRTSLWLVPRGSFVREGDRVLEVLAGEVTFDIVSPATGVLCQQSTEEDEIVLAGQILGHIRATDNA